MHIYDWLMNSYQVQAIEVKCSKNDKEQTIILRNSSDKTEDLES